MDSLPLDHECADLLLVNNPFPFLRLLSLTLGLDFLLCLLIFDRATLDDRLTDQEDLDSQTSERVIKIASRRQGEVKPLSNVF